MQVQIIIELLMFDFSNVIHAQCAPNVGGASQLLVLITWCIATSWAAVSFITCLHAVLRASCLQEVVVFFQGGGGVTGVAVMMGLQGGSESREPGNQKWVVADGLGALEIAF